MTLDQREFPEFIPAIREDLEKIAESENGFPVDFDAAWQWIGYSSKQKAREALERNFIDGTDFLTSGLKSSSGGRPLDAIDLTVDCFKQFCMMAGTDKGRDVRKYYIQIERGVRRPETAVEWAHAFIRVESKRIQLEAEKAENAPKVADWEKLMGSSGCQNIGTVAKMLGWGQNKFFSQLRADGILRSDNLPFARHEHHFEVKTTVLPNGKNQHVTLVKPEGMVWLRRKYTQELSA